LLVADLVRFGIVDWFLIPLPGVGVMG